DRDFLRYLREAQDRIGRPIEGRYAARLERDAFQKGTTDGLNGVSFDLVAQTVGIDDQTAIVRYAHTFDADRAGLLVNPYVDNRRHVSPVVVVVNEPYALSVQRLALARF